MAKSKRSLAAKKMSAKRRKLKPIETEVIN